MARPKTNKVTRLDYCQYLFSNQVNYTLTNFAEHVEAFSHDIMVCSKGFYLSQSEYVNRYSIKMRRGHTITSLKIKAHLNLSVAPQLENYQNF